MEALENKAIEMTEELDNLTPGSEEYLNQAKAIKEIAGANAENKKVSNEEKFKKFERWTLGFTAGASVLMAIAKLLEPVLRRQSNKDWIRAEDEGFYVSNKDNR